MADEPETTKKLSPEQIAAQIADGILGPDATPEARQAAIDLASLQIAPALTERDDEITRLNADMEQNRILVSNLTDAHNQARDRGDEKAAALDQTVIERDALQARLSEIESPPPHTIARVKYHTEDGSNLSIMTQHAADTGSAATVETTGRAMMNMDLGGWLARGNEIEPYYTITAAVYSNAEGTAVTITTEEAGRVLVTQSEGKRDRWATLERWQAAGGTIGPFVDTGAEARAKEAARLAQEAQRTALLDALITAGVTPEKLLESVAP